jgi:hypothetical protein
MAVVVVALLLPTGVAQAHPADARITTAGFGAVKICMTERQVEKAAGRETYGSQLVRERHAYTDGLYLKIVDGDRKVVFEIARSRVTDISTGRLPEIDYIEGCA